MSRVTVVIAAVCLCLAVPGQLQSQDQAAQVRQAILDSYEYTRTNLTDPPDAVASSGSLEFWSSGGFLQRVQADPTPSEYESFGVSPRHIQVTMLSDDVAMAHFYAEGPYQLANGPMIPDYRTRALQVFVRENGEWKVRAAHWSPIQGGAGTSATAPQN